jgi:hypothetical protein
MHTTDDCTRLLNSLIVVNTMVQKNEHGEAPMISPALRVKVAAFAVVAGVILLGAGLRRTHKVYAPDAGQFGVIGVATIGERQLVIDATFSGVQRKRDRLCSTYDRSAPHGKRACPT